MPMEYQVVAFASGEITPKFHGRVEMPQYAYGLAKLENMFVTNHGGARKRPGTMYVDNTYLDGEVRLIRFGLKAATEEYGYVIALSLDRFSVYDRDGNKFADIDGSGNDYVELATAVPKVETLQRLKYLQVQDVLYLFHEDMRPQKITFDGTDTWTCVDLAFDVTGKSQKERRPGDADGNTEEQAWYSALDLSLAASYPSCGAIYDQRLFTARDDTIHASNTARGVADTDNDPVHTLQYGFVSRGEVLGQITNITTGTTTTVAVTGGPTFQDGDYVEIREVSGLVDINDKTYLLGSGPSPFTLVGVDSSGWSGSYSANTGVMDRVTRQLTPQATDTIRQRPQAYERMEILWMLGQNYLLVGSTDGLWRGYGPDLAEAASGVNSTLSLKRQSSVGADDQQAILVQDYAVFVQRGGHKIRQARFQEAAEQFITPDLTLHADHLFYDNRVYEIHNQQLPSSVLWAVREGIGPATMAYSEETQIQAWSHHTFSGEVETMCTIAGELEDRVFLVTKRVGLREDLLEDGETNIVVNAENPLTVDFMKGHSYATGDKITFHNFDGWWDDLDGETLTVTGVDGTTVTFGGTDASGWMENALNEGAYTDVTQRHIDYMVNRRFTSSIDCHYVDSGIVVTGNTGRTISGLDHIRGESVAIWADGGVVANRIVNADGEITLDDVYDTLHIGLPFTSVLTTLDIPQYQSRIKRIHNLFIRFHESIGCKIGPDEETLELVPFTATSPILGQGSPLFTGVKENHFPGVYDFKGAMTIVSDQPAPLEVLGITAELETYD